MKYSGLKRFPWLVVPLISTHAKNCPVHFRDIVVYAYLIYRARKQQGCRVTAIGRSLQVDRRTTKRSLDKLQEVGLVRKEDNQWYACEPNEAARQWLIFRKEPAEQWIDTFVYMRLYLPRKGRGLTVLRNALFWMLVRLATQVEDAKDHLYIGPGAKYEFVNLLFLAKALRINRKTVRRGLRWLAGKKLITVQRVSGKEIRVGIPPIAHSKKFWRASWQAKKRNPDPLTMEELFSLPSRMAVRADVTDQSQGFKTLAAKGIPRGLCNSLLEIIDDLELPPRVWEPLLDKIDEQHHKNLNKNPNYPEHCGRLFLTVLQDKGVEYQELARQQMLSQVPTLDKMVLVERLDGLRASDNGRDLLWEAIRRKSFKGRDGSTIPISLSMEEASKVATNSKDWDEFKKGISNLMFGPDAECNSEWQDQWKAAEALTPTMEWPSDVLPLFTYTSSDVVRRIKDWAREQVKPDIEAARLTNRVIKKLYGVDTPPRLPGSTLVSVTAVDRIVDEVCKSLGYGAFL